MKYEYLPTIRLEIRPMVANICQAMGIAGSELAEAIEEEATKKLADVIADIPNMVAFELNETMKQLVKDRLHEMLNKQYGYDDIKRTGALNSKLETIVRSEIASSFNKWMKSNTKD